MPNLSSKALIFSIPVLLFSSYSQADYSVSVFAGQGFSQELNTSANLTVEVENAPQFGFTIEKHISEGRYGFFVSSQSSELSDREDLKLDIQHLLFQSSTSIKLADDWQAYFGIGLGASKIAPDFQESDTYFAGSLYSGAEYFFTENLTARLEGRWIATVIKNDNSVTCSNIDTDNNCRWIFDGEAFNQFQTNLAISWKF